MDPQGWVRHGFRKWIYKKIITRTGTPTPEKSVRRCYSQFSTNKCAVVVTPPGMSKVGAHNAGTGQLAPLGTSLRYLMHTKPEMALLRLLLPTYSGAMVRCQDKVIGGILKTGTNVLDLRVAEHNGELWIAHTDLCVRLAEVHAAIEKAGTLPTVYLVLDWTYHESLRTRTDRLDVVRRARKLLLPVCKRIVWGTAWFKIHDSAIKWDIAHLDDKQAAIGAEIACRLAPLALLVMWGVADVVLAKVRKARVNKKWDRQLSPSLVMAIAAIASVVLVDQFVPAQISPKGLLPPKMDHSQGDVAFRDFV